MATHTRSAAAAAAAARITQLEATVATLQRTNADMQNQFDTLQELAENNTALKAGIATLEAELARRRVADTLAAGDAEDDVYSSATSASECDEDDEGRHKRRRRGRYLARDYTDNTEQ